MPAPRKYPKELREWAQRMVAEAMSQDPALTLNGAISQDRPAGRRYAGHVARLDEAVRHRCRAPAGCHHRGGLGVKEREREVRELKRGNGILLAASSFFAPEFDPRLPW